MSAARREVVIFAEALAPQVRIVGTSLFYQVCVWSQKWTYMVQERGNPPMQHLSPLTAGPHRLPK